MFASAKQTSPPTGHAMLCFAIVVRIACLPMHSLGLPQSVLEALTSSLTMMAIKALAGCLIEPWQGLKAHIFSLCTLDHCVLCVQVSWSRTSLLKSTCRCSGDFTVWWCRSSASGNALPNLSRASSGFTKSRAQQRTLGDTPGNPESHAQRLASAGIGEFAYSKSLKSSRSRGNEAEEGLSLDELEMQPLWQQNGQFESGGR